MKIIEVQTALAALGFNPGPLDGVFGRQTAAAVREFQASVGLDPDGIVGPKTLAALLPGDRPPASDLEDPALVWFKEARRLIGTRERPGRGSNPVILDWATDRGIPYGGDDIPWCGLFVAHCIGSTLDREPIPRDLLRARAWERFGAPSKPTPGAILVFWRRSPQSGFGHVGFYAGEDGGDNGAYRVLGGNQSDSVGLTWIAKNRCVAVRWPATVPPMPPRKVVVDRNAPLSWDEA